MYTNSKTELPNTGAFAAKNHPRELTLLHIPDTKENLFFHVWLTVNNRSQALSLIYIPLTEQNIIFTGNFNNKYNLPGTHALLYIIYRTECLISLQTIAGKNQNHYQELRLLSITVTEQIFIFFQSICSEVWFPSARATQYSILRERA